MMFMLLFHFQNHSNKEVSLMEDSRYMVILPVVMFLSVALPGCRDQPGARSKTGIPDMADGSEQPERRIRALTDRILLSLATHRYASLAPLIEPGTRFSEKAATGHARGREAAYRLLGAGAERAVLNRWDAQLVTITLDANQLEATASVDVEVRPQPNSRIRTVPFTFRFRRQGKSEPWYLLIP